MAKNWFHISEAAKAAYMAAEDAAPFSGAGALEERASRLVLEASRILQDEGKVKTRREVRALDTVDVTGLIKKSNSPDDLPVFEMGAEVDAFLAESAYHFIPPFMRGAFRVNRNRYVQFDVKMIDGEIVGGGGEVADAKGMHSILLCDYSFTNGAWLAERACNMVAGLDGGEVICSAYPVVNLQQEMLKYGELFRARWSERDWRLWEIAVLPSFADPRPEKEACSELAGRFLFAVGLANFLMSREKPRAARGSGRKAKAKFEAGEPTGRSTRVIGGRLKITSEAAPRVPGGDIERTYRTPEWSVVGHVRRYKNGKTVYIKPQVRKRHGMDGCGGPAQKVIKAAAKPTAVEGGDRR